MKKQVIVKGAVLALFAGNLNAAALYLGDAASPQEIGFALSGMTARAQDAGTVYTNPAGMTRIEGNKSIATAGMLYLYVPLDTNSGTTIDGPTHGSTEVFPYGSYAYVHSVSDKLKLGVNVSNNYGLSLDWSKEWVGRYTATKTTILAPQLQPTVGYKVNDWLSVGAGVGLTLGYLSAEIAVNNKEPGLKDGFMKYSDFDYATQGNLGIMIEPNNDTRIGFRYLTQTSLNFNDNPSFKGLGPGLKVAAGAINNVDLNFKMPQSIIGSVFHQLNNQWAVLGSLGWEEWSKFGNVQVGVNNSGLTTLDLKYKDTWHAGIGGQYKPDSMYTYNMGFSYDSELSSDAKRSLAIPLGQMFRFGFGGERQNSKDLVVGVAADLMWEGDLGVTSSSSAGEVNGHYANVFILFTSVYAKF